MNRPAASRLVRVALVAALASFGLACGSPESSSQSQADPLSRGLAARAAGRLDEAERYYHEALAKDPKDKYALFDLGEVAQTQNRLVAAEAYYRLALEQDPAMERTLYNLAIALTAAGQSKEAIDLYRRAVAIEPNHAAAHYNLGVLLRQAGQGAEAQKEFAIAEVLDRTLVAPNVSAPQASPTPRP
jgi:tetratricopeptide (TPR) repeat protein